MYKLAVVLLVVAGIRVAQSETTTMRGVYHVYMKPRKQVNSQINVNGSRSNKPGKPRVKSVWKAMSSIVDTSAVGCFTNVSKSNGWKDEMVKVGSAIAYSFPMYRPQTDNNNTCIQDCVLKRLGMMKEDGTTLDTPFAKSLANIKNPTIKDAATKKYEQCTDGLLVTGTDPCQKAGVFLACMGDVTAMLGPAFKDLSAKVKEMNIPAKLANLNISAIPSMLATLVPSLLERVPGRQTTGEPGEGGDGSNTDAGGEEITGDPTGEDGEAITTSYDPNAPTVAGQTIPAGPTVQSWGPLKGPPTEDPFQRFPFFGWF